MNKYDIVKLLDASRYKENGLSKNMHGIQVDVMGDKSKVLFFDENSLVDAIVVVVENDDLFIEKEKIPEKYRYELENKVNKIKNDRFSDLKFKSYDIVELMVSDEKYRKYGIEKGQRGCVMEYVSKNRVLVDFSGVDDNGNYYGDCLEVNINEIEKIN